MEDEEVVKLQSLSGGRVLDFGHWSKPSLKVVNSLGDR